MKNPSNRHSSGNGRDTSCSTVFWEKRTSITEPSTHTYPKVPITRVVTWLFPAPRSLARPKSDTFALNSSSIKILLDLMSRCTTLGSIASCKYARLQHSNRIMSYEVNCRMTDLRLSSTLENKQAINAGTFQKPLVHMFLFPSKGVYSLMHYALIQQLLIFEIVFSLNTLDTYWHSQIYIAWENS